MNIELHRFYTPDGTLGRLTTDGLVLWTIERAWAGNRPNVSCIPEGVYELKKRDSAIVKRTTHGVYTRGWELVCVPNRSLIMIHIANTQEDLEGCIGVGESLGMLHGLPAVLNSGRAFDRFMHTLSGSDSHIIDIRASAVEYP